MKTDLSQTFRLNDLNEASSILAVFHESNSTSRFCPSVMRVKSTNKKSAAMNLVVSLGAACLILASCAGCGVSERHFGDDIHPNSQSRSTNGDAFLAGKGDGDKSVDDLTVVVVGISHPWQNRGIVVRFENHSQKPIRILRPLDGSECGWHMPFYTFTVLDRSGAPLPLRGRCGLSGLYSNMTWPDDYRVQILPADAYEMWLDVPHAISAADEYNVKFEYRYDPTVQGKKQRNDAFAYPEDLWIGSARSGSANVFLNKTN